MAMESAAAKIGAVRNPGYHPARIISANAISTVAVAESCQLVTVLASGAGLRDVRWLPDGHGRVRATRISGFFPVRTLL